MSNKKDKGWVRMTDRQHIEVCARAMGCEIITRGASIAFSGRRFVFNDAGEIVKIQEIKKTRGGGIHYITVAVDQVPQRNQAEARV